MAVAPLFALTGRAAAMHGVSKYSGTESKYYDGYKKHKMSFIRGCTPRNLFIFVCVLYVSLNYAYEFYKKNKTPSLSNLCSTFCSLCCCITFMTFVCRQNKMLAWCILLLACCSLFIMQYNMLFATFMLN